VGAGSGFPSSPEQPAATMATIMAIVPAHNLLRIATAPLPFKVSGNG
jgi:hypothetical protein